MVQTKKMILVIIGAILLLIGLIGITYSFFNYTRTGAINNLGTGRISFNTNQSNTLNITNVFPMTSNEAENANLDSVTISITGDTTYADGEEFLISLVDVENTINGKEIPISFIASYEAITGNSIGTSSNDYFNERENKDASIYSLNASGEVTEGEQVLVGYIDNEGAGINGTLTIKAYIDADRIVISDTYYENATATPVPTAPNDEYGTTTEWVDGRIVLTTSEWNSLSSTPISFKIRAESNEGIWVDESIHTIESCPNCNYLYSVGTRMFTTWNIPGFGTTPDPNATPVPIISAGLYDDYQELVEETGKNYFLGVELNSSNQAINAYACGVKDDVPFCIKSVRSPYLGGTEATTVYEANDTILRSVFNSCYISDSSNATICGNWSDSNDLDANSHIENGVKVGVDENNYCYVSYRGYFECYANEPDGGR